MWATALYICSSLLVCHVLNSLTVLTPVQIVIPHTNGPSLRTLTWLEVLLTVLMQLFLPVCTALHFFPVFFPVSPVCHSNTGFESHPSHLWSSLVPVGLQT